MPKERDRRAVENFYIRLDSLVQQITDEWDMTPIEIVGAIEVWKKEFLDTVMTMDSLSLEDEEEENNDD